jgi:MoaA/NifB/PqqE/SkfB family radical SAM enzyme
LATAIFRRARACYKKREGNVKPHDEPPPTPADPRDDHQRPRDGLPWHINIGVTARCNLYCEMCQMPRSRMTEPAPARLLGFLDRLAEWLPPGRTALFTGGEPLLHVRLTDFLARLGARGFKTVVNTNGSLLTPALAVRLIDAGLGAVNFSLDGLGPTHDRLRRGPGLYQGVMDMIHYLTARTALAVNAVVTVHAQNAAELPALVRRLLAIPRFGVVRLQAVIPTLALPWSTAFFAESALWPRTPAERAGVLAALDELDAMRRRGLAIHNPASQFDLWRAYFVDPLPFAGGEPCRVGDDALTIQADGGVAFCPHLGVIGSVDDDPRLLWESPAAARMREAMRECPRSCNERINCCFAEG